MTRTHDVALVVPVHADTAALARLLARVARFDTAPAEIVVAASARDAALERLCAAHGARLVTDTENRGAQLDTGARAARAGTLWFMHAPTEPPLDGLETIAAALAAGAESGCFELAFAGEPRAWKSLVARLTALRIRLGGVAYGDQALFATRAAYEDCGGFAREPLFEEVGLVRALKKRGTFRIVKRYVRVSTRRWERDGWLRRALGNRWLALRYALGAPAAPLARSYRAVPPRDRIQDKEARS